jgi:hypothetical protein
MNIPEHVELCETCGLAPVHDMTIPKWVFEQIGQCFSDCDCSSSNKRTPEQIATQWENLGKDTEDQPDEQIGHDYHRELHQYLVEKGEREE